MGGTIFIHFHSPNVVEVVGKMTGDSKTEAEGRADQIKGKTQNAVGGLKDKAREVLKGDD